MPTVGFGYVVQLAHRAAARGAVVCKNVGGQGDFLLISEVGTPSPQKAPRRVQNVHFRDKVDLFSVLPSPSRLKLLPDIAPMGGIFHVQARGRSAHGARNINFFPEKQAISAGVLKFLLI